MPLTYNDIKEELRSAVQGDYRATVLWTRLQNKGTGYKDAHAYAIRVGTVTGNVLKRYQPEDLAEWDLEDLIPGTLGFNHNMVAAACNEAQKNLNTKARIGIRPKVPEFDGNRAFGLVEAVKKRGEIGEQFYDQLTNFDQNVVDQSIRDNGEIQSEAGLSSKIVRTAEANCCKWCDALAGTYDYADVSDTGNEVWQRHDNCRCTIEYYPGKRGGGKEHVSGPRSTDSRKADRIAMAEGETTEYNKSQAYNSKADPMAEAFGRGTDSHPEEIKAFRDECERSGVSVIEKEHEALAYQPSPTVGNPGQLTVNPDASYAAWSHEMKHMRDDRESGWDGALRLWDKDDHAKREEEAYAIEINMAEKAGRSDIADRLRENLEAERRRIYGSP